MGLEIGDAVLPRNQTDHDVMTVYDFIQGFSIARCNWVVGTRMFRLDVPVKELMRVQRACDERKRR